MVDVSKGGGDKHLRERVGKLTKELDGLESRYNKACDVFRAGITVLSSLGSPELEAKTKKALNKLKKESAAKPIDPDKLGKAVDSLKNLLLADPGAKGKSAGDKVEIKSQEAPESGAGRHVLMALLAGLRLGDKKFDTGLDQAIKSITASMSKGKVRPAMVELADLLDQYKDILDGRRKNAETALKEVLHELLKTEQEISQVFLEANSSLSRASLEYDNSVTATMSSLVKRVNQASDLDTLRTSVVEHVRSLRETMRNRRAKEEEMLQQTKGELERMKSALEQTKGRMEEVERLSEKLNQEALTDPMTHIWNKRAFSRRLTQALSDPRQNPVCLVVFDIDHFKTVNDTFGHQAGDKALRSIAEYAGKVLRGSDTLFRYAGDEFCIVLVKSSLKEAAEVAERVRKSAANIKFTYRGENEHTVSISLGLSQSLDADNAESLFKRADENLLEAKRTGRNRVVAK